MDWAEDSFPHMLWRRRRLWRFDYHRVRLGPVVLALRLRGKAAEKVLEAKLPSFAFLPLCCDGPLHIVARIDLRQG